MTDSTVAFLLGTGLLFAYYVLVVGLVPVLLLSLTPIPRELARKFHHIFYGLSIFILVEGFTTWYLAVLGAATLVAVAYPALLFLERQFFFQSSFAHREGDPGELRRQMVQVQITFALLLAVIWGIFGPEHRYVVVAAVMGWSFGDAAAALFGKAFGKRKIRHKWVDDGKTHEGSWAMTAFVGAALFLTLFLYGGVPWWASALAALSLAPLATAIEAFSPAGTDTFTVPIGTAAALYPLLKLLEWSTGRA